MNPNTDRISNIFTSEYSDFLDYCALAGKEYAQELTSTDYVAFRTQYGWSREAIEEIRTRIASCMTQNDSREVTETVCNSQIPEESSTPVLPEETGSHLFPGKELSTLEEADIDSSDTPFYIRFNVDPVLYANVPVEAMPLNARSLGILKRGTIHTIEKLLFLSEAEIFKFRQSGRVSVKHIVSLLSAYLSDSSAVVQDERAGHPPGKANDGKNADQSPPLLPVREMFIEAVREMLRGAPYDALSLTEDEKGYMGRCVLAKEVVGEEACLFALENPQSAISLLSCLMRFREEVIQKMEFLDSVREKIAKLPPARQAKRLPPYLRYCAERYPHLADITAQIPEETDIQGIAPFLDAFWEHCGGISADGQAQVLLFLQWLNYDFSTLIEALRKTLERWERGQSVLDQRAKGATLEQIASTLQLTRERIRQMENKAIHSLLHTLTHAKYDLIHLIYLETGEKSILHLTDVEIYLGPEMGRIIWYLLKRKAWASKGCRYDAEWDAIVFSGQESSEKLEKALKSMPALFLENEMETLLAETAERYELPIGLLREHVLKIYRMDGVCYHCERLTIVQMCLHILKERFQNGYKIADELDQKRFLSALREFFGKAGTMTSRALDAKISIIGFLCDRGKYVHPDYMEVPQSLIDEINRYISDSPRMVLPYAEIYQTFSERFIGTKISNRYGLQGALKKYGCPFILRKDYVTKDRDMSMTEEFSRFIESKGEVYKSDILEEFTAFSDSNIMFLLNRCPEIISLDNGRYMHASCLRCPENERAKMAAYLRNACQAVPVSVRSLLNEFTLRFTDFMVQNNIDTPGKLFGILQYLFRDTFHFSRPYISVEDMGNITRRDVVLHLLDGCDSIEISDLMRMCEENGTLIQGSGDLIRVVQPEFLRVDESTLMRRDLTGLTEEAVEEAVQNIQEAVQGNNGYCSAKNITDYSWYPVISVEWNPFVLESVAALAGDALPCLRMAFLPTDVPLTVFTGEQYADDDMNSLIVKVLSEEHRREPFSTQSEVLRWLQEQGLCNAKLPDFLTKEGYLFTDESGRLRVEEYGKS